MRPTSVRADINRAIVTHKANLATTHGRSTIAVRIGGVASGRTEFRTLRGFNVPLGFASHSGHLVGLDTCSMLSPSLVIVHEFSTTVNESSIMMARYNPIVDTASSSKFQLNVLFTPTISDNWITKLDHPVLGNIAFVRTQREAVGDIFSWNDREGVALTVGFS